ncbi:MAG: glycosyltransferase family protein [Anaerolineae bacterium]
MPLVIYVTNDVIGPHMAGPGIRSLELARVLAQSCSVTLAAPVITESDLGAGVTPFAFASYQSPGLAMAVSQAQVLICDPWSLKEMGTRLPARLPVVVDLYDLTLFEDLARWQVSGDAAQTHVIQLGNAVFANALSRADLLLVATERQRDYLLGALALLGRLNPSNYAEDATFASLVAVVPCGCREEGLDGNAGSGTIIGVGEEDKLVLWGGGLWDWLDPLTAIRAMAILHGQRPEIKLLFPGTVHPNSRQGMSPTCRQAMALAESLGLLDKSVLFGHWVPYAERVAYLRRADVGLSLHRRTAEAHFAAIRSRVLDYLWADLPMVVSEGDVTAELVRNYSLGEVVAYDDPQAVAAAIVAVLAKPRQAYRALFAAVRCQYTWQAVAKPLLAFCRQPRLAPDSLAGDRGAFAAVISVPEPPPHAAVRQSIRSRALAHLRALRSRLL